MGLLTQFKKGCVIFWQWPKNCNFHKVNVAESHLG